MENGAFAPKFGANAPFSINFQIHDISKASKGVLWSKGLIH